MRSKAPLPFGRGVRLKKMPLEEYRKKRDFKKTIEPEPSVESSAHANKYVIQKHQASHLHYDLRLEMDGVLKSWAVPKEPPADDKTKRLAVETEDHPLAYAEFEGMIPEGQYGAGKVEIWDSGTYELLERDEKKIEAYIRGKKLSGRYVLLKMKPSPRFKGEKNWLFFKVKEVEK